MKSLLTVLIIFLGVNLFAQQNFTVEWESGWEDNVGFDQWERTNSIPEIVIYNWTDHILRVYDGATKVLKYNYSDTDSTYFQTKTNFNSTSIDVNNDGINELFRSHENGSFPNYNSNFKIINGANGQLLYQNTFTGYLYFETVDIDGDSYTEVCLSQYDYNTYKRKMTILSTTSHASVGINNNTTTVTEFKLGQNYPNPFNPTTTIEYSIAKDADVQLELYNDLGQLLKVYPEGSKKSGSYSLKLDGTNLASGAYFYRLIVNGFPETKKMVMIK